MTNPFFTSDDLRRVFENLDRNGDGRVSIDHLNWLLEQTGVAPPLGADDLVSLADGKSSLDFHDFSLFYDSLYMSARGGDNANGEVGVESDLAQAFKVFDVNGDGFIACDELESVLARLGLWEAKPDGGGGASISVCVRMIGAYDMNSDGRLDFEEFKRMMMLSIS